MGKKNSKQGPASLDHMFTSNPINIDIPYRLSILNSYRIEKIFEEGKDHAIMKTLHLKTRKPLVTKKLRINKLNTNLIMRELYIMNYIDHINIVQEYEYFQTKSHYFINYDYFDGINIIEYYIKNGESLTSKNVKLIIKELLETLTYIHNNNILIRGLDPKHILYNGKEIKIISLQHALIFDPKVVNKSKKVKFKVNYTTPFYQAPEVIKGVYDIRADLWVVGVLTHVLVSGKLPFESTDKKKLANDICEQPLDIEVLEEEEVNADCIELIKGLLEKDPDKRLSIADALKNKWFNVKETGLSKAKSMAILSNMKVLMGKKTLLDGIMNLIADKAFINDEIKDLKKLFKKIDVNKDGVVDKGELMDAIERINLAITEEQIDVIFKKYDDNKSGTLEFKEFAAAFMEKKKLMEQAKIEEFYDYINTDKKEKISLQEFEEKMNYKLNTKEKAIFNVHAGNDKCLTRVEFVQFIQGFLKEKLKDS